MSQTFDKSEFYVTQKLGPKRSRTPEGYLLCEDVAVGRVGTQLYGDNELLDEDGSPVVPSNGTGIIQIERSPEEVFRPETMASAHGKPVTLGHVGQLSPENYRDYAMGNMSNIRRGDGSNADLFFADLLITDKKAIKAVLEDGIEEVSLGYDAKYEVLGPGRAAQRNIVINHVALVDSARCGPRCAIGDSAMSTKNKSMSFADRLRRAFSTKDEAEAEKMAKEVEDAEREEEEEKKKKETEDMVTRAVDKALKRFTDAFEKADKEDKKDDKEEKTEDALLLAEKSSRLDEAGVKYYGTKDAAQQIAQRAEIISPGFRVATFDSKASTMDKAKILCGCQRKVLDAAYATDQGRKDLEPFLAGQTIDALPVHQLNAAFIGLSEIMRHRNNAVNRVATRDFGVAPNKIDVAKRYVDFGKTQNRNVS